MYLNYTHFIPQINYFQVLSFIASILFITFYGIYSLHSIWEKVSNILFSLKILLFNGFIATYQRSFNLTIRALLILLLFGMYKILSFSSNTVIETLALFISNSLGLIW